MPRKSRILLLLAITILPTVVVVRSSGQTPTTKALPLAELAGPFSSSNTRTETGTLIPSEQFFPAARCATCHRDSHNEWSESLPRNSGREPCYTESVDSSRNAAAQSVQVVRRSEEQLDDTLYFENTL